MKQPHDFVGPQLRCTKCKLTLKEVQALPDDVQKYRCR